MKMGILELQNQFNETTNNTNINSTFSTEVFCHKSYLSFILVLMVAFFILSYYLYYVAKYNIKKAKNTNKETNALFLKYSNLKNLSLANFIRGISIIYILITLNKNGNDIVSFLNFFCHIFPSLIFFSIFFSYIRFLIEKFYEIKTKKKDIFFDPSMQFFNILIYLALFILTLSCLTIKNYISFMYLGTGLISILSLILSLLYLFYGVRLANIYAENNNSEIKEKKFIHNRILFISIIVGTLFMIRAIFCFFISINVFKNTYPTLLHVNIWDFCTFLFNEFLISLIIGYTRQRDDSGRNNSKFNLDSFDFNKNYQNYTDVIRGDLDKNYPYANNDLHDPLLDKFNKLEKE